MRYILLIFLHCYDITGPWVQVQRDNDLCLLIHVAEPRLFGFGDAEWIGWISNVGLKHKCTLEMANLIYYCETDILIIISDLEFGRNVSPEKRRAVLHLSFCLQICLLLLLSIYKLL